MKAEGTMNVIGMEVGALDAAAPRTPRSQRGTSIRRLCVLIAAAILTQSACKEADDANVYAPPPPPEVIVAAPLERDVTSYLFYTGTVEASEKVELRARIQGFLRAIHFQPGQRVKKDDLLFEIDPREYQAQVAQIEATAASAKAQFDLAVTTLERAQDAFSRGGTSDLEVREKKAARDEAQAALDLAQARLQQAKLDLEYCEVRAPIEGRIGRNLVDVGNLVGRGESTLLAEIVQATPSFVSIDISESDVLSVRRDRQATGQAQTTEPGQVAPGEWRPCELALADQPDYVIPGRIDYVDPQMNPSTGTLRVRTRFENTDEVLLPGFFSRVRFPMSSKKATLVPDAALLSDQLGRYALIVNDKDEVEVRRVTTGILDGSLRVVEEGLTPQDRVIVLGVLKARPGSKVTPKLQDAAPGR
ncbi:MAG: efflux RND transporter periplasmic adaptor subunit [Planctomycetota bacterium]|nr:efflux RND transporter periplasmic adaptor subunit [Planctomycetota bacterium]